MKNPVGRKPLFIKQRKNDCGIWKNDEIGTHDLIPKEFKQKEKGQNPISILFNSCYFCGRIGETPTHYHRFDTGTRWEIMEKFNITERDLDLHEEKGLYENNIFHTEGPVPLLIKGYGIKFREKFWIYQLCPECQPLLKLPHYESIIEETNMNTVLLLTGRAMKTGNETRKSCYFCGRHEGTDSVNLLANSDGSYQILQAELYLKEVIRAVSETGTYKYFLCPECEVLLGLSPRIVLTEDGGHVNGESFFEAFNKYTDINNAFKDADFVKKAAALINSIGAEEFLNQLISNLKP
jgi:hypothetical protein